MVVHANRPLYAHVQALHLMGDVPSPIAIGALNDVTSPQNTLLAVRGLVPLPRVLQPQRCYGTPWAMPGIGGVRALKTSPLILGMCPSTGVCA